MFLIRLFKVLLWHIQTVIKLGRGIKYDSYLVINIMIFCTMHVILDTDYVFLKCEITVYYDP